MNPGAPARHDAGGYRLLLRLAPRRLRERHGREMEAVFCDHLARARHRGRVAAAVVWCHAAADIASSIPRELVHQWRRRGRVGLPPERRSMMIGSDLRYAWRSLNHQRFGSLLVIGMLALGIGSTVAVFSLVNGLFLRPFPFPEPERLVYVNEAAPKWNLEITGINYHDYAQWRRDQRVFEAIALYDPRSFNLATEGGADRMEGASVTMDFMKVLGLQPVIGRMFTQEEDSPKGPLVTLIGEAVWRERFGARPDVLGKELKLNSRTYTIIGVLPKAAEFPGGVRLWVPMQGNPNVHEQNYTYEGLARLKPGVTLEQANADLVRTQQVIFDTRDKERVVTPFARDLRAHFTRDFGTVASTLGAAVSLLLIVACANVAALMLARALSRRREIGIRLAVGAGRGRLLRQLLVENIMLSIAGGAAGLAIGQWAISLLVTALPEQAPSWTTFTLDGRTIFFTIGTSVMTAILFGWAPALHAMNHDVRGAMATAIAGSTAPVRGRRTLWALVIAEFALASLMFVCGGLLVRAYDRVRSTDPGFDPSNVLTFTVAVPAVKTPDDASALAYRNRLVERMRQIAGVTEVGLVSCAPVSNCHWGTFYTAENAPPRGPNDPNPVILNRVASPEYFSAMGLRLKEGRFFNSSDGAGGRDQDGTIIVNESFVNTTWPGAASAVGKRLYQGSAPPTNGRPIRWLTVVGVTEDVKHYGLERPARPGVYLPLQVYPCNASTVVLKIAGDPASVAPAVQAAVREVDPEIPAYNMRTMDERLALSRSLRAAYSWMLGVFAVMALLLALGGSYGVTSYLVSQRTRELGIRVALGAKRGDISSAVLKGSVAVVSLGVAIGVAGGVGAGRLLASLLFGVPPYDVMILAMATVALLATGLVANWLPARRAARVDPMVSLRAD
ncbi:MAG TPA: ABC transporter permease [Vicinamibacterales bacterium]|nr:ABC transporter permease [Vicinamibacterales bacterium]